MAQGQMVPKAGGKANKPEGMQNKEASSEDPVKLIKELKGVIAEHETIMEKGQSETKHAKDDAAGLKQGLSSAEKKLKGVVGEIKEVKKQLAESTVMPDDPFAAVPVSATGSNPYTQSQVSDQKIIEKLNKMEGEINDWSAVVDELRARLEQLEQGGMEKPDSGGVVQSEHPLAAVVDATAIEKIEAEVKDILKEKDEDTKLLQKALAVCLGNSVALENRANVLGTALSHYDATIKLGALHEHSLTVNQDLGGFMTGYADMDVDIPYAAKVNGDQEEVLGSAEDPFNAAIAFQPAGQEEMLGQTASSEEGPGGAYEDRQGERLSIIKLTKHV
jgi:hypothetical protein